ncbi:MAG: class I SAM-dependent methyltransferase [Gammaproteobacteria bacterium]|nr:class I SAM-dependent methyltransferase [Gammaproteobacteria bacterium]MBU1655704.1 class I SAM-dependent methyltransferase [Gammaproteobacteria bacterium]MBU1961192.1 class I SAM-dependent methyltransferase [Gammaproteobacteria bacterium]
MMTLEILTLILLVSLIPLLLSLWYRVGHLQQSLGETRGRLEALVQGETRGLFSQLEADRSLRDRLDLHQGLPYSRNWSASPDFLKLIVEHCLEARPARILECSSGLTTLMLARCCQLNGQGHVYSLENGAPFAAATGHHLDRYGVADRASLILAPLENQRIKEENYLWYGLNGLPVADIDMLVIDGPPGFLQRHSRYPALPLLFGRLSDACVIFLDDAARQDEKEIVMRWKQEFPAIRHEFIPTERGCSVFRLG